MYSTLGKLATALFALGATAACANGIPLGPSKASSSTTASATTSSTATPPPTPATSSAAAVAYTPDLQPIFNSDCVPCHGA